MEGGRLGTSPAGGAGELPGPREASAHRSEEAQAVPSSAALGTTTAARWLRMLQRVTDGAIAHLDLPSLLHELLAQVREAMGVDNAAILLVSEDGKCLNLYAANGLEEDVTGRVQVPMGQGVAGSIAASGKPRMIEDLSTVEVEDPLLRATAHSLMGAPLMSGTRVIGVLHVASAHLRYFTEDDSQLLPVIASQIALAIEHARLYAAEQAAREQAETATRHLQALQEVSDVALEHARLHDLLRALLLRIQRMLEVHNVAILLPTPDGSELTLYSVQGPEEAVMGQVHVPMGQGVAGTIAASRKPLFVENLALVPVANPFLREHFRSLLGVPLLDDGRLVGVIHVDSVTPRTFTDDERRLVELLAERIARAIARAQQYERVQESRTHAERQVELLRATTDRMDEFLSIASHELRTPLTSLTMSLQMADFWLNARRGKRANESDVAYQERAVRTVQPLIRRATQSTRRLDRLVGELLDASRVRENRLELRQVPTNLVALAAEVVDEFRQTHPDRVLRFEVAGGMGAPRALDSAAQTTATERNGSMEPMEAIAPMEAMVDPDRIRQVLSNYIGNALKFSQAERPIMVRLERLRIEGDASGRARLAVRDEGIGVAAEEVEHIWERFYRVSGVTHQSGSQVGLGLGLYISREIVERHGGQVGVHSAPGKGATFWCTLPLMRSAPGESKVDGDDRQQTAPRG